ncbi:E3 ubiquitin-protein ligase SGR9, amyloplastic [Panicum miliaceum]|uniref:E3 ubiquitin-protein ligase SGR9, amyloplastic n=1 Tax=Panicum miliaceum TaxID=4540 RepID=A0A3L6SZ13_PANMI|nr:E3 ubiquitin-protein ligase SGR9, amyloplastic [Panicum miliaceum]
MEASHGHGQPPPAPSSSETLMAAFLNVPAARLHPLVRALAADARRLRCRLAFLLLSPPHFARALARLRSMPLPAKAALLGRVLLRSLLLLLPALCPAGGDDDYRRHHLLLPQPDLDAALLLLAMCDSYSPPAAAPSPVDWRAVIVDFVVASTLSVSGLGATPWAALAPYVDAAAKCRRFADVVPSSTARGAVKDGAGSGAASHAVVLALPAAAGDGAPCAICRDAMAPGRRGVCALRPCGHRFHWRCALRWLARRNTCPCCRAELPAQDAAAETRRLWRAVERTARGGG